MQLDLLQKEQPSVSQKPKSNPTSKPKQQRSQVPVLESKEMAVSQPLPPLPESLRPPFAASEADIEDIGEDKAPGAFKTISEVASILNIPQHVLRFWESRFGQIKPLKLHGGRRYYRPEDIEILTTVKNLLYKQGYTIKGAKKAISHRKSEAPAATAQVEAPALAHLADKKQSQLNVLRQELIGLRDTLAPLIGK